MKERILDASLLQDTISRHSQCLADNLKEVDRFVPPTTYLKGQWSGIQQPDEAITKWDTGVEIPLLQYIGMKSVDLPPCFVGSNS